jgi:hypothetical protein
MNDGISRFVLVRNMFFSERFSRPNPAATMRPQRRLLARWAKRFNQPVIGQRGRGGSSTR